MRLFLIFNLRILLTFGVLFYAVIINGQTKTDSLNTLLKLAKEPKKKSKLLLELSKIHSQIDYEKSIDYAEKVVSISKANDFDKELSEAYNLIAVVYMFAADYNKSLHYLDESGKIARKINNKKLLGHNYGNRGIIFFYKKDFYMSFVCYNKALEKYREIENYEHINNIMINIATIFYQSKDYERALSYYKETLALSIEKKLKKRIGFNYLFVGQTYMRLNKFDNAIKNLNKGISYYDKELDFPSIIIANIFLGKTYYKKKDYNKSFEYFNKAKNLSNNYKSKLNATEINLGLANLFLEFNDADKALEYGNIAFKSLDKKVAHDLMYDASKILSKIHKKLKNYDEFERFMELNQTYKDSLMNNTFLHGKLLHEIKELEYKSKLATKKLNSNKNLIINTLVISFTSLLLLFFLYHYKKQKTVNKKLEISNNVKSAFIAKVTHEIRTPLNAIVGFSELIKTTSLDQEQLGFVTNIKSSVEILVAMSENILSISKPKDKKARLIIAKNNLTKELKTIEQIVLLKSATKNINFTIVNEVKNKTLYFDKTKLQQILLNLFNNAIKYTDKEGDVTLIVNVISETKAAIHLNFIIKDTGIGIDKKYLNRIKEEFYQINKNEKWNDGVGLGLSIVSNLLNEMNSKLEIDSVLKQGSSFSFKLKFKKANPDFLEQKTEIDTNGMKNVLIVDDNKINMLLIKQILIKFYKSIKITEAFNGEEGLKAFIKIRPSLIIMDLQMPIMDGYQATKHIRKLDKNVPILVCSANILSEKADYKESLGFTDYLAKPIDINKFNEKLNKYLV